ncbi:hypothetical protein [Streptomyces celluloflavus]|uniref:hypothetical protein n=1 Tax=Streptomyces celluloflavus TaxID=58344 RepID=UPI00366920FF
MRRAREWFGGLTEAGKVALVAAVITTVGGGVFGVVSAATSALGGGGGGAVSDGVPQKVVPVETPSGHNTPDGRPDTPDTSLPTHAAECEVRSKVLYCTGNKAGIKLYRQRDLSSEVVHTLVGTPSRYSCWGHGSSHSGGNDIWYWTHFKGEDYWGNAPAVDVNTNQNPAPGLPKCS